MINCELIVRDVGSRIHFLKYLNEAVGTIGLKETKWIVDCMPPYTNTRTLKSSIEAADDLKKITWKSWKGCEDWDIFIDDVVPELHLIIQIDESRQKVFKKKLLELTSSSINNKDKIVPDFTLITKRELREEKLKDILDDNQA